jgi:hypothetical protein
MEAACGITGCGSICASCSSGRPSTPSTPMVARRGSSCRAPPTIRCSPTSLPCSARVRQRRTSRWSTAARPRSRSTAGMPNWPVSGWRRATATSGSTRTPAASTRSAPIPFWAASRPRSGPRCSRNGTSCFVRAARSSRSTRCGRVTRLPWSASPLTKCARSARRYTARPKTCGTRCRWTRWFSPKRPSATRASTVSIRCGPRRSSATSFADPASPSSTGPLPL